MDRRRAAGALLALAACIASSAAAPTSTNHTALDLYDAPTEGCYYNFQHYGEGDRIMTNEPCLNCTCHNRMLMCYLRVCPFTKAIGQDCTVEKRADQCCPIVTCPDVPVDLLTSTSTSSPAEYGGTGIGKVDKYGCSINGKYFSEGAKVPPTPGKPCEHCYCIRNMTTCVMQECTLHVDGCTPIYHKDVCCPVRYFCDHPEDEMPLLDDMTTTVRPTPGFLLTTTAPTEEPMTTLQPARRDCIEDDQLYPDGALIKTEKPCEHCYCMKGDIVCVVQECGTPMENEGKNCSSLPPREGQCCPDTYICEGDELSTEPSAAEIPIKQITTTIVPPRRVSVEGSGYRNEPDEITFTEAPTIPTEFEGSGEEQLSEKPETGTTYKLIDRYGPTEETEFISLTTQVPFSEETEKATTEPDKGLNTVPSGGMEEEQTNRPLHEKTTTSNEIIGTEYTRRDDHTTLSSLIPKEDHTPAPSIVKETPTYEIKATEPSIAEEPSTVSDVSEKETPEPLDKEQEKDKVTETSIVSEPQTHIPIRPEHEVTTEASLVEESSSTEPTKYTDLPSVSEQDLVPEEKIQEASETTMIPVISVDAMTTVLPVVTKEDEIPSYVDSRRTSPNIEMTTSSKPVDNEKIYTEAHHHTTLSDRLDVTETATSEQNTVPVSAEEEQGSVTSLPVGTTVHDESKVTEAVSAAGAETTPYKPLVEESSEPSILEKNTTKAPLEQASPVTPKEEEQITTEPTFRKEDEITAPVESTTQKEAETEEPSEKATSTEKSLTAQPEPTAIEVTTKTLPEQQKHTTQVKEVTTETIMELSTFAHESEKEATTVVVGSEAAPTATVTEKGDVFETTTVNLADNEIAEVPSPGRIPGEGDCLLEGTTYKNESIVPSSNKCHSGCKCVSSIIKCDPIICSPPPENMDNCQPRYDTPESCCPTYVCDHGMETIPPQPQSHMTGIESPTPSTIECHGDECKMVDEKLQPTTSTQIPDKVTQSDCGSSGCDQTVQVPVESCIGDKCKIPQKSTESEYPQGTPTKEDQPQCVNEEDCKKTEEHITVVPCEGESCIAAQDDTKPAIIPIQEISPDCDNKEECKQVKIPQTETALCKDESCRAQDDCSTSECKIPIASPQPTQEGEICSEDNGCRKTGDSSACDNGVCDHKQIGDETGVECKGPECMQQQPILPTQESSYTESLSTEPSALDKITSSQSTDKDKIEPVSSELPSTLSEEVTTAKPSIPREPENEIKEPEPPVSDEQEKVTVPPTQHGTSEITTLKSVDMEQKTPESSLEDIATVTERITETPLVPTTAAIEGSETEGSEPISTDALPTEPSKRVDEISETEEKDTEKVTDAPVTEEGTKSPETEYSESESETEKPHEEIQKPTTESQSVASITVKQVEDSSEAGIKTTESLSNQEPHEAETVKPEVSTISDVTDTKSEASTKLPSLTEEEITTETIEKVQTETPIAGITEPIKLMTEEPKDSTKESTTIIPARAGTEEQFTTTTSPAESQTETQIKEIASEIPGPSEYTTTERVITREDEGPQQPITESLATTSSPEKTETEEPLVVETGDLEKVTTTPESTKPEDEKQTETPLSLFTKQAEADSSTMSITESDEKRTETSTKQPQDSTQESPEPEKNASELPLPRPTGSPIDTTKSPEKQEITTEIESSIKLDEEPPVTEKQELPEAPVATESSETSVTEKQELPEVAVATESSEPSVTETQEPSEAPFGTESSETSVTEKQELPKAPVPTDSSEPSDTEKQELPEAPASTESSEPSVTEEQKLPEAPVVTESSEPSVTEKQKLPEAPVATESSAPSVTEEQKLPEAPVATESSAPSVTEEQKLPEAPIATESSEQSVTEKQELPEASVATESSELSGTEKQELPEAPTATESSEPSITEKQGLPESPVGTESSEPSATEKQGLPETPVATESSELSVTEKQELPKAPVPTESSEPSATEKQGLPETPVDTESSEPSVIEEQEVPEAPLATESSEPSVTEKQERPEVTVATESSEPSVAEKQGLPETPVDTESSEPSVIEEQEVPEAPLATESSEPSVTEKQERPEVTIATESSEPSVIEKQELPEAPVATESSKPSMTENSVATEASEAYVTEQQQPSTKIPSPFETESPTSADQVTETKEPPQIDDDITSPTSPPIITKDEIEKATESREPSITEEQEINTETPEKTEEQPHQTIIPEIAPTDAQDMLTQEPELIIPHKPIERVGEPEQEQKTEVPVLDVKQPETTEKEPLPTASHEPMTDSPEHIPEEQGTTALPQEISTISEKFITKQTTITESPESQQTSLIPEVEHLTTVSPQLYDTGSPKLSTVSLEEEAQTEAPLAHEKLMTPQSGLEDPEISKTTTISSLLHDTEQEDKQTEQPGSLSTSAPEGSATMSPVSDVTKISDLDKEEQKPHEKLPESTESAVEASSTTPEDKQKLPEEPLQSSKPVDEHSETTPYLVELEEHTHKQDEVEPSLLPSEEPTDVTSEPSVASSEEPSVAFSEEPTVAASEVPVVTLSEEPTVAPTQEPLVASSKEPSLASSEAPLTEESISSEGPIVATTQDLTKAPSEEPTTVKTEVHETETQPLEASTETIPSGEKHTELPEIETERPFDQKEESPVPTAGPYTTISLEETPEKSTDATMKPTDVLVEKYGSPEEEEKQKETPIPTQMIETEPSHSVESEKPTSVEEPHSTVKPQDVPVETTAPEEEFIPVTAKATTSQAEREGPTQPPETKPDEKPSETPLSTAAPEVLKPDELQPTDEVPSPEDDSQFPPSGGYNQEPDYVEEDQAFGPGTCRYGGKVYVSAQQIPRDDPCDFCFCFRSDIICLQQSCPPPIHGCHEEPIQGFCCPRYECPVSMATTLNVTTTTTTTTTTLPPHFLPHAYKGAAQRKGCQIKGHTYQVGEVVRASSGPCLHCTCGGDGQMKCDPKQCTPEPMLRQMIAAAVSAKRRR